MPSTNIYNQRLANSHLYMQWFQYPYAAPLCAATQRAKKRIQIPWMKFKFPAKH